jgi:hypothetical protein
MFERPSPTVLKVALMFPGWFPDCKPSSSPLSVCCLRVCWSEIWHTGLVRLLLLEITHLALIMRLLVYHIRFVVALLLAIDF